MPITRTITLEDGTPLTFDGKVWNSPKGYIKLGDIGKDSKDGYYKAITHGGKLAVQNVDENGKPLKREYIGEKTKDSRKRYWEISPIIRHATDSIANEYGINANALRHRLSEEGFVDEMIKTNNFYATDRPNEPIVDNGYDALHDTSLNGFWSFGLDDVGNMLKEGKIKLKNENWYDGKAENEKGREVNFASGKTTLDNIGITAATLKYFRDIAAKDYPNANSEFLDKVANIYYNRGISGGRKYLSKGGK